MNNLTTEERFSSQFLEEEKEILVLIETKTDGAFKLDEIERIIKRGRA